MRHWKQSVATVGLVFAATIGGAAVAKDADTWVIAWQASPEPAHSPAVTLSNQTIRQVVRVGAGGNRFRLRLSNEYGTSPLHIDAAHVAISSAESSTQLGTDHVLTFGGEREVVIPEHAYVMSDPVDITLAALEKLAISIHVPGTESIQTENFFALQSGWIAPKDVTGAALLPSATTITRRLLLTGVEVAANTHRLHAVVTLGDSITGGFGSTLNTDHRWPDRLAERLAAKKIPVSVVNASIGGNRLLHDFIGPNVVSRFDRDVLLQAGVTHVILLIGINDFGLPGGRNLAREEVTVEQMMAGFRQLIARAHQRGVKVIAGTLLPFGPIPERPGYFSATSAAKRESLNQWIRSGHEFDGVIDFDAALRDPAKPNKLAAQYDSGDHLDPNDDGYKAMAEAVDLKLLD
jgi:lysophospholipase L1-like esterase